MIYNDYLLHTLLFWICISLCVSVFMIMMYALIKFRKKHQDKQTHFYREMATEILWAVIPFIIIIILLIPTVNHFVNI